MTTTDPKTKWNLSRGDGNSQPLSPEKFASLKEEFEQLCSDAGASVNDRREWSDATRFCRWAGQSADGKKHEDAMDGEKPFPFEGASDARIRTADELVQEQVIVLMASLMRMQVGVTGTEGTDMELAADINVLWRWVQKNQLGVEWFTEMTKLAQYRQGDSPAVGILQVNWHEETALKPMTLTPQDVLRKGLEFVQQQGIALTPEQAADAQDIVANPARQEEFAAMLRAFWPELREKSADKAARDIQEDGETTVAYPYPCENRLKIKTRRLFEDIFIPENTPSNLQRARVIFVREWFTETELREMDAKGLIKPGFLEEVLEHEGESCWRHICHYSVSGDYSESLTTREWDKEKQRGQYELITAFLRSSNDLGIPGIYSVQYHGEVETPGTDLELFESPKNKYPFFANPREILNDKLWDSRGICELSMTEQASIKQLHDSFMDHVQLTTVPPLEVPASRPKLALVLRPLGLIKTNRPGEIRPINLGAYPVGNDKADERIEVRLARYFGRMAASNTPDWVRLYQQNLIDGFFVHVAAAVHYALALTWEYLPDDVLERVLGHPMQRDMDQIDYDVQISFEAGMLNLDFLSKVGQMITEYALTWDTASTVQRDKLVRWFFSALSPTLAQELLVPVETANAKEVEDEQRIFGLIAAGVEPPMMTSGQNWALRLQTEMEIGQKNPEAWEKLTPKSREILEARLKHLQGQVQQQQNANTGRTMARPALEQAPGQEAVEAMGA